MSIKNKIASFVKNKMEGLNNVHPSVAIPQGTYLYGSTLYKGVLLAQNTKIHKASLSGAIKIGSHTALWGPGIEILSKINNIEIGNFCSIGSKTSIISYNHNIDAISTYHIQKNILGAPQENDIVSKGSILIGNDVWIGSNSTILSGAQIGHGVVVAAGSVVKGTLPDYAIAAGVPAKVKGFRFSSEVIARLLQIKWWNWGIEKIKLNQKLFEQQKIELKDLDSFA